MDINSGINTSDEVDILTFIIEQINKHKENKKIHTLVVVNKADNMQLVSNDELEITGELNEMFDQVKQTITDEYTKANILDQLIGIIPFCALDAYLYRMIHSKNTKFQLKPEVILKIGINEQGKSFSKLSVLEQKEKVTKIISNKEFIDDMIKLSGFSIFVNKLNNFLTDETASKLIIDNLMQEYTKLIPINEIIKSKNNEYIHFHFCKYNDLLIKINANNKDIYLFLINKLITDIDEEIKILINITNSIRKVLNQFNHKKNILMQSFLIEYYDKIEIPDYVKDRIVCLSLHQLSDKRNISFIIDILTCIIGINCSIESITECIKKIIHCDYKLFTITFLNFNPTEVINFFNKLKLLNIKLFIPFIRFIILNYIEYYKDITSDNIQKYFMYKKCNEIFISSYLYQHIIKQTDKDIYNYIYGFDNDYLFNTDIQMDVYYLQQL